MINDSNEPASLAKGPVVIVEGNIEAALHAERVIEELQPTFPVQVVLYKEDLVAYLKGKNLYQDRSSYPYPGLVLLDLTTPRINGFDLLEWIKGDPDHGGIPIVALSDAANMAEAGLKGRQLGADAVLPKPVQPHDVRKVLSLLKVCI